MTDSGASVDVLLGRSKVRQRILALLFERPERRLHLRGIARAVAASAGTTARELDRLVDSGLVLRSAEGSQVYFQADRQSPLFESVRTIVQRTIGGPAVIRRHLIGLSGIERAFVYGSHARGSDVTAASDIDLMIIGKPDVDELTDRAAAVERDLGRPLNYTILSDDELRQRRLRGDRFIASVDSGPSLTVLDASDA
jgi:predicted nucleotidyltransferase/predicted transcriptional regulator with HTH domain